MARTILGIDPAEEPERARKAVDSHLARARWMTKVGYRLILAGQYPGAERDRAKQDELLQSLGIGVVPPDCKFLADLTAIPEHLTVLIRAPVLA